VSAVSGLTNERAGIPASQMFSWKKRFREAEVAKFVEVAVKPALENTPAPATRGSATEVRLKGGRSLVVAPGFDVSHLRALLRVLENEA
jgi:hypothetical protein